MYFPSSSSEHDSDSDESHESHESEPASPPNDMLIMLADAANTIDDIDTSPPGQPQQTDDEVNAGEHSVGVSVESVRDAMITYLTDAKQNIVDPLKSLIVEHTANVPGDVDIISHVLLVDTRDMIAKLRAGASATKVAGANIYDAYLKTKKTVFESIANAVGKQLDDDIIIEHEKVMFMIIEKYVVEKKGMMGTDVASSSEIRGAVNEILTSTDPDAKRVNEHLLMHIAAAFNMFYFFKMGASAVDNVNMLKAKAIQVPGNKSSIFVPRDNNDMIANMREMYNKDRIESITSDNEDAIHDRLIYLNSIVKTFAAGGEPMIDHAKYFGTTMDPVRFVESEAGAESMIIEEAMHTLNTFQRRFDYYVQRMKTGASLKKDYERTLTKMTAETTDAIDGIKASVDYIMNDAELIDELDIKPDDMPEIRRKVAEVIAGAREHIDAQLAEKNAMVSDAIKVMDERRSTQGVREVEGEGEGDDEEVRPGKRARMNGPADRETIAGGGRRTRRRRTRKHAKRTRRRQKRTPTRRRRTRAKRSKKATRGRKTRRR